MRGKPKKASWAKAAVEKLSDAEVRRLCKVYGIKMTDDRTPLERLIDETCGAAPPPKETR